MDNLTDLSTKEFLTLLASDAPAPGGGGAAAVAGGLAAALASMLANLTIGKKKFAEQEAEVKVLLQEAEPLRQQMLQLVQQDAEVFDKFMQCYKLPKNTEVEQQLRTQAISEAAKKAAEIPMEIAVFSVKIMELTARLAVIGNPGVITDGAVSGLLARAAVRSSVYNVLVNLPLTKDAEYKQTMTAKAELLEQQAAKLEHEILTLTDKIVK